MLLGSGRPIAVRVEGLDVILGLELVLFAGDGDFERMAADAGGNALDLDQVHDIAERRCRRPLVIGHLAVGVDHGGALPTRPLTWSGICLLVVRRMQTMVWISPLPVLVLRLPVARSIGSC